MSTDGPSTLVIAGTAGAEPDSLAEALSRNGWSGEIVVAGTPEVAASSAPPADLAILALDPSMPADDEEVRFLTAFASAATPTALVVCGVESFPSWPRTLAASRARLDRDRRLPVFATAAALLDEPGCASGIPELAAWCADLPDRACVPRRPSDGAGIASGAASSQAALRADRLAGLRTGVVAARGEAASSTRAALAELSAMVPDVCAADGFADWLPGVLDGVEQRSLALFRHRLAQVRAAALCGLDADGAAPMPDPVVASDRPAAPPRRRAGPDDVLLLVLGASMGFGVGRMVLAPALSWAGLGTVGTVLSLAAGLLLALWVVSVRRESAERARIERWAVELIAARRSAVEQWIGAHAGAMEAHVTREIWNRTRTARV